MDSISNWCLGNSNMFYINSNHCTGNENLSIQFISRHGKFDQQVTHVKGNDQSVLGGNWMMDDGKLKTGDKSDDRAFDG